MHGCWHSYINRALSSVSSKTMPLEGTGKVKKCWDCAVLIKAHLQFHLVRTKCSSNLMVRSADYTSKGKHNIALSPSFIYHSWIWERKIKKRKEKFWRLIRATTSYCRDQVTIPWYKYFCMFHFHEVHEGW